MDVDLSNLGRLIVMPFHQAHQFYLWLHSFGDPRVKDWFLMDSPFPTLLIVAIYLIIVRYGPYLMITRKPLELRLPMVIYNFAIAWLNCWIGLEIAAAIWWYYFSKCLEFTDTILFIVRKKPKQLTFLHIYHHSTMFAFWWVGAKFVPGGSALTGAMVNCFVHVVMYSYYGLAALGPRIQKYLWWKKYLTILQLMQFSAGVILGLHAIITNCQFTRWMQYFFVCYAFSFILLFSNFYNRAYGLETVDKSLPKKVH